MTKKEKIIYSNGIEYEGGLIKGKPHGKGTIRFFGKTKTDKNKVTSIDFDHSFFIVTIDKKNPLEVKIIKESSKKDNTLITIYKGQFKNGKWHGKFKSTNFLKRNKERHFTTIFNNNKILSEMEEIKYPNGDVYFGELKDGKYHGQGTFKSHYGSYLYVGEWKNNTQHGKGTITFVSGGKYIGQWKNDAKHGNGTHTWPHGVKYVGGWKNNNMHGKGTHTWPNGDKYVGDWKDGKKNGKGTNTWANGDKYVGGWKNSNMHGKGTHTWNGDKYVGGWKDNAKHGKGTYTFSNGVKEEGMWREDKLIKEKK